MENNDSGFKLSEHLNTVIICGLEYLENTQVKFTEEGKRYAGEWKTTMQMNKFFFYLGGGRKKADDSNCFSIASIHSALAQIYLIDSSFSSIPTMIQLAYPKILSYRNGRHFNFWNLLPPKMKLKKDDVIGEQPLVRRPTNFVLKTKYISNATNITEDADDTALGYLAIGFHRRIFGDTVDHGDSNMVMDSLGIIFDSYRDQNRNNRHWYNHLRGNDHETGAYLTWLGEEYQFKNWNILKTTYHNGIWFHKSSECYPHPYVPYIPYGSNDLDAVVNADVLSSLGFNKQTNANGMHDAINFVEKKVQYNQNKIGIYYPNRYHFSYAVSEAFVNDIVELDSALLVLIEFIKETQNKDGSWSSRRRLNKKDIIQSTAYALNVLVNRGDYEALNTKEYIEKGISFLLEQSIHDDNGIHWEGGVFFSGGTLIRNMLIWKSDAYTTAIILKAFVKYNEFHTSL